MARTLNRIRQSWKSTAEKLPMVPIMLVLGSILYMLYTDGTKLGSDDYGANIGGLKLAPWISIFAIVTNMFFSALAGFFNWRWIWKYKVRFSVGGCATGVVISSGAITLALAFINLTAGGTVLKAEAIPASLLATILFLREERQKLIHNPYQIVGGLIALWSVYLSLKGISSGHIGHLPLFVKILFVAYFLACLVRFPIMRTMPGDEWEYYGGEQVFAALTVFSFFGWVAYGDITLLPLELHKPFLQMQDSLQHPSWQVLKWGMGVGFFFGLYAPASFFFLAYKKKGATALLGAIMQKKVGVAGVAVAPLGLHLAVLLFYDAGREAQLTWYKAEDLQALGLLTISVIISTIPQMREWWETREKSKSLAQPAVATAVLQVGEART